MNNQSLLLSLSLFLRERAKTKMLVLASLFIVLSLVSAQGGNPNDYVCDNVVISPSQWERNFPVSYQFNGFWRADGSIKFLTANNDVLFAVPLNGSIWHQYHDQAGHLIGDLFLEAAAFGFPGLKLLTSRQVTNPMLGRNVICQKFLTPSPSNLIASYSELVGHGKNYMDSKYFSLENATLGYVFSNEQFSFSLDAQTAISRTATVLLGNGDAHFVFQEVNFRYTRLTEAQALALGWSGDAASVPAGKGFALGRGAAPIAILNANQRAQLGL